MWADHANALGQVWASRKSCEIYFTVQHGSKRKNFEGSHYREADIGEADVGEADILTEYVIEADVTETKLTEADIK